MRPTRRNTPYAQWPDEWKKSHREQARRSGRNSYDVPRVECPRCSQPVGLTRYGTVALHKTKDGSQWCEYQEEENE